MGQQTFRANDFLGLTPAVDPRASDRFYALGGKNYVFDTLGPKSVFGNRYLTPYPLGNPEHVQSVRLRLVGGDRVFHLGNDCISEWREDWGGWRIIYVTGDISATPYRWTYGYLNGYVYFCHPATGILVYSVDSDTCLPHVAAGVPTEPFAICVNNGRLCVMDSIWFTWSGPGNGLDFVPRLGGAGMQKINDRVAGDSVMLSPYARGVLVWTTGGVMRCEFTGDAAVYRFRAINTEYRLINPFCSFQMDDDTVVIMDERGLFQSKGEAPSPLTPLFNEYLIKWLQKYDLKIGQNVRLEWDELQRRLFVSVSLSEYTAVYEKAFVLYPPLDKWGTFDESHYAVGPILIQDSERGDDYFGFVDDTGRVKYWDEYGSREVLPSINTLDSHYPTIQKPAFSDVAEDGVILSSSFTANTVNGILYEGPAGYSEVGAVVAAPAELTHLDSVIHLGLLRLSDQSAQDRLMEVNNIFIASNISGEEIVDGEDWNLIPDVEEDYNILDEGEDYGLDVVNYVNHGLRLIGTLDGKTTFHDGEPELIRFTPAGRYYSCAVVGLWHILELSATNIGESYHLRIFEINATDAGRLT